MENKCLKTDVYVNENLWSDTAEQPIDVDFTLPDYCPDISKVFKCRSFARISSKSINDKSITVEGSVCLTLLYCDKDNKICSFEYQYPFSKTREIDLQTNGCNLFCSVKTDYINCRAVTGRKVDIHGAVSIYMRLFRRKSNCIISDIDDCNVETKRINTPVTIPMGYAEKYVLIEEEIPISAGSNSVERILRYDAYPSVNECKLIDDKVMTKGEMALIITYCCENSPLPQVLKTVIPFSQIVDMAGVNDGCECETKSSVAYLDVKPKTTLTGECRSFSVNAKLLLCSEAFCSNEIPVISDAFSRKFEAEISKDKISFNKVCENIKERFSYKTNIDFADTITSILDLWCDIQSQSVKFADCKMFISGVLLVGIVSVNDNNEISYCEKTVDFEYSHALNQFTESMKCTPEISIISCNYTINSPSNIEFRAEFNVNASVLENNNMDLICDIKIDENKLKEKVSRCALTIYFATGSETLWDIARIYNASVDEIMKINDITQEFIPEGSMLLVPLA